MINVGIIGSAGYVAGELIRCLIHHPKVKLDFLYSSSQEGQLVSTIHQDLFALNKLRFTKNINPKVALVFLCLGHGNSKLFLKRNPIFEQTKIIDLSNDFRLQLNANFQNRKFIYGLVELNKSKIKQAKNIANPGCFATGIQLSLVPLANAGLLNNDVHITAITGATGAGQSLSATSHFSWRNNNISAYKAFKHPHLTEILESLLFLQDDFNHTVNLIPVRGGFTRGLFFSIYMKSHLSESELVHLFQEFYNESSSIFIQTQTIHLKQVVNTNNCIIKIEKINDTVFITCAIDNLLKGAAGQAIQNMNLMFDLDQNTGLNFKGNYF